MRWGTRTGRPPARRLSPCARTSGRLVLSRKLTGDAAALPRLASFAAGRIMREEATLAFGDGEALLWQAVPADSDDRTLLRLFETFADSCDWWRERLAEREPGGPVEMSEAVILP